VSTSPGNPGTPEKSRISKRRPGNPANPEILLIIQEKSQNNAQYLLKQGTMMIKDCSSQNEIAIININKEGRKLMF